MDISQNITARETLIALSVIHKGVWSRIYSDIKMRNLLSPEEIGKAVASVPADMDVMTFLDPDYPTSLRESCAQPPIVLYLKGDRQLLQTPTNGILAIAGDIKPSDYSKGYAAQMGAACAQKGVVLFAKLSRGCASEAIKACAQAGGKCVVIMSSGIDRPYPNKNETTSLLKKVIEAGGLIVSEYPAGTDPEAQYFVSSSRIVATAAKTLFVPELSPRSGTSIVVAFALNAGRDVAVLAQAAGNGTANNQLIKDGAYLVDDVEGFLGEAYPDVGR